MGHKDYDAMLFWLDHMIQAKEDAASALVSDDDLGYRQHEENFVSLAGDYNAWAQDLDLPECIL
jgi:hypothetical protein